MTLSVIALVLTMAAVVWLLLGGPTSQAVRIFAAVVLAVLAVLVLLSGTGVVALGV